MNLLEVTQGSPEWLALRSKYDCASEAPVMMAASSKMTRNELLRIKATGSDREFSEWVQRNLFDKGHAAEAAIRPYVETIVGEDLFPVVGVSEGYLASFDGLTMAEDIIFEHKLWNETLAASVRAGELDPEYYWQLEHQLMVSRAKRVLFVVSDGTPEKCLHMFYRPVDGREKQLIAGWAQFRIDRQNYQPVEVIPAAVATPVEGLPAVAVKVDGSIAITSNLDLFGEKLRDFIRNIVPKPESDQDFADCELAVKVLERAEDALKAAEANALAQTASVDEMRRTVALLVELARTNRLSLEKLVKARKEAIRIEIAQDAQAKLSAHIAAINARLGKVSLPPITANFVGVMKGKKTVASCRSAVDDELARVKIEANEIGEKIDKNLRSLRELAAEHAFLFVDAQQIVLKSNDDLVLLINSRIGEHHAAEERKQAVERERIRAEEAKRAQEEAEKIAESEREKIRAEERERAQGELRAAPPANEPLTAAAEAPQSPLEPTIQTGDTSTPAQAYSTAVDRLTGHLINLGTINSRIAPLSISAEGLVQLGFQPAAVERASKLYRESDFARICAAIVRHVHTAAQSKAAA